MTAGAALSEGQPVIILGMGRSGTSIVANLLQRAGVSMYRDAVPPNAINPRGFSEERTIVDFHQKLKRLIYSRFDGDAEYDSALVDEIKPLDLDAGVLREAEEILSRLEQSGFWGWKDPRTTLFSDLWLTLIPRAKIVVPLRHPMEIMASYLDRIPDRRLLRRADQVFRSYSVYHRKIDEIVTQRPDQCFVFYAHTGYQDLRGLWESLEAFLGGGLQTPEFEGWFNAKEFTNIGLGPSEHELFAKVFREAAMWFDRLNAIARPAFPANEAGHRVRAVERLRELAEAERAEGSEADWVPLLMRIAAPSVKGYSDYVERTFDAYFGGLDELLAGKKWLEEQCRNLTSAIETLKDELNRYQRLVEEQNAYIGNMEQAKAWFVDQLHRHQQVIEEHKAYIAVLENRR